VIGLECKVGSNGFSSGEILPEPSEVPVSDLSKSGGTTVLRKNTGGQTHGTPILPRL
jgi:hypothetical protein